MEKTHEHCVHVYIRYDEGFHTDDRIKIQLPDNLTFPNPNTCYAIWKLLSDCIENRKAGVENTFFVQWKNMKFNVVEINSLKCLGLELLQMKTDVQNERTFLMNAKEYPIPEGMVLLGQDDDDVALATEIILKNNLYLKENLPLNTIDRTEDDYLDIDNEMIYNFSSPDRQFREEDLHLVTNTLNNQKDGKDLFIVYTPELRKTKECEEYVRSLNGKSAKCIHVILNVARGLVNLTHKDGHWVYSIINSEDEVLYGDPLGSKTVPSNLLKILNPIYRVKYGKDINRNIKVINVSNNVNFPSQTCGTICGLISAMICIFSFCTDLYREIMFSRRVNTSLELIKNPSEYKEQIRLRFLKLIMSRKHCALSFIPVQIQYNFQKDKEMLGKSIRKTKSVARKAWEPLMSKSKNKFISSTSRLSSRFSNVSSRPRAAPSAGPTVSPSVRPKVSTSAKPTIASLTRPTVDSSSRPPVIATTRPTVSSPARSPVAPFSRPTVISSVRPKVVSSGRPEVVSSVRQDVFPSGRQKVVLTPGITSSSKPSMEAFSSTSVNSSSTTPNEEPSSLIN